MHDQETREKAIKWLNTSITIRQPKSKQKFCDRVGISVPTLNKWEAELRSGKKISLGGVVLDDLPAEEQVKVFKRLLFKMVQDPKTPAKDRELFAKMNGLIIDKSINLEVKIGADELFRARNEARRELEGSGFTVVGSGEVRPQPSLLSEDLREDKG